MSLFTVIGSAVSGILGLGGVKSSTSTSQADFAKMLADQKAEMTRQMNLQAQESKKTLTLVAVGGGALILVMFLTMKK